MDIDTLINPDIIKLDAFPVDPVWKIRIARADQDKEIAAAVKGGHLEVQAGGYTAHYCTIALVGSDATPRPVANLVLDLRQIEEVIRYNPAKPGEDYVSKQFTAYNAKTQADFSGAKKRNLTDYTMYGLEALRGERRANIPEINGWCDEETAEKTLFVVLQQPEEGVFYGRLYFPSVAAVMQADGQTQTAMLFSLARTPYGAERKNDFRVKLEIEFGVTPEEAGDSFADRNGRGVKKDRNLVADLTSVGGIAELMTESIKGTIFEEHTFKGRGRDSITETSTHNILDLATLEQVIMNACTYGNAKPEHIKDIHVATYLPYVREFLKILETAFKDEWPEKTPEGADPYRAIYVHGWSFSFKALSRAYYRTKAAELGPLNAALKADDLQTLEPDTAAKWKARATKIAEEDAALPKADRKYVNALSTKTFADRLGEIDWTRHRAHWIAITGFARNTSTGRPKTKTLKDGTIVIKAKAPSQQEVIGGIEGTILGTEWTKLKGTADYDWKTA